MLKLAQRLALAALLCLVAGCATPGGVTLPPLPAWRAPVGDTTVIPVARVVLEAQTIVPGVQIDYSDDTYTIVSDAWLDEYLTWTWSAAKAAGVFYVPGSFDCEDFTIGFYFFATRAAAKANLRCSPLIARVVVQYDATSLHELAGVVTDLGIFIVEPQPDAGPFRKTLLANYPKQILHITFGDKGTR